MAEMVGSVVVGEVVNRTFSFLISKHSRERLSTREGVERLEMAHIKMEAALELSSRWQHHATDADASLLRWRRKLRRAADECDAALHRWKLRELQEEDARERLARAPLPRRVAHAVLCFLSALLLLARARGGGGDDDACSHACAAVRRFERLASGAAEFLRCVEFGSAPRRCGGLFGGGPVAGRLASYERLQLGAPQQHRFLGVGPASPAEVWADSKPCRAYPNRRPSSGKKLLLV
ncbi:uncharacterized protein [Zea mays]|jgi:hypothetical protein|uniref:Rx N-terminal domain-containing protein n=1 Tax=Zea mays TaxID=4577 RepID=K7VL73_MAIZE|nr:uncharacterized protein LOC103639069 [Zea mays]AQL06161.1 hypothetical protein ZEAMMB73_Zm00001d047325 [Zea mays]|eukprot:XP_008660084.1 uncharacterized protein LOC103639069 [Zea mays]